MSKKSIVTVAVIAVAEVCLTTLLFFLFRYNTAPLSEPPEQAVVADNAWAFYMINRENPLPTNLEVELAEVQDTYEMDARCADYARLMIAAARADGIDLMVCSAYRSPEYQQRNYDRYVNRLISEGYTEVEAAAATSVQIADPYASEHCAGLALDIISRDWWNTHNDITDEFENTPEFEWLEANSWRYGFILRYQKGKEDITGYIYEPWHYRFIGLNHAERIYERGVSLEEYFEEIDKEQ